MTLFDAIEATRYRFAQTLAQKFANFTEACELLLRSGINHTEFPAW